MARLTKEDKKYLKEHYIGLTFFEKLAGMTEEDKMNLLKLPKEKRECIGRLARARGMQVLWGKVKMFIFIIAVILLFLLVDLVDLIGETPTEKRIWIAFCVGIIAYIIGYYTGRNRVIKEMQKERGESESKPSFFKDIIENMIEEEKKDKSKTHF